MKSHLITSCVIGASLLLTGCLNETPKGLLSEEDAYDNAVNLYINSVATLYNYIGGHEDSQGLQGTYRGVYDYNTFTTDEAIIPTRGGDWYDGEYWQNLYQHEWTDDDEELYNTWKYLFKVVVLSNNSLAYLDKYKHLLSEQQYRACRAEVRGIRALYYFYLIDMFGNIPLVVSSEQSINEVKQSSRSNTFKFIVKELQEIEPDLADVHSNKKGDYYGRITRSVAYFLLAKLMLNAEVYADDNWTDGKRPDGKSLFFEVHGKKMNAWEACAAWVDLIRQDDYWLSTNYEENFSVNNENSSENIFVIPMDKLQYQNYFCNKFRSFHYNHASALGVGGENGACATVSTVRKFGYGTDNVDPRYALNFYSDTIRVNNANVLLDNGTPLVYYPLEVKLNLTGSKYEKTAGARMAKYEVDRTSYTDGRLQANDIVLFRYADALLMKAEANYRNGDDGYQYLSVVCFRSHAKAIDKSATQEEILSFILDERLRELMWEGWRRQDLIRYDLFHRAYDQRTPTWDEETRFTTVFPIPKRALDLNRNLTQNPGY